MPAFQTSQGNTLSYGLSGSGPALVCHPGGPGFSSLYLGDLAGLDRERTLILLDPRGTGSSSRPADGRAYGFDDYANDLEELRTHLEVDQFDLVGHSHGGTVAMRYAASFPGRVRRLVLASTLARFGSEQSDAMVAGMEAKAGEPWYEDARAALEAELAGEFSSDAELGQLALREFPFYFARYGEREADYLEGLAAETPNADALLLFNHEIFPTFDLRPDLERITAKTLVITGAEDFITGPVCARELAAGIAGAQLDVLPNVGHFIFVEAAEAFRDSVLGFLRGG
jgi:pimeloyl-ACP methyl ester carboxylesterase